MKRIWYVAAILWTFNAIIWGLGGFNNPLLASRGEYWKSPCIGCSQETKFNLALWGPHELDRDLRETSNIIRFVERKAPSFDPIKRYAQLPMTGAGLAKPAGGGGGGFVGPGDTQSGYKGFWGTMAFTTATRGNRLMNVCDNAGANCQDLNSDPTTGMLVGATLTGGTVCPGPNCRIKIWYDISAALNCNQIGFVVPIACDLSNTTAANMPKLLASQFGSNPAVVCTSAAASALTTAGDVFLAVSTGSVVAAIRATTVSAQSAWLAFDASGADAGVYNFMSASAQWQLIAGDGSFTSLFTPATAVANTSYVVIAVNANGAGAASITAAPTVGGNTGTFTGSNIANGGSAVDFCVDNFSTGSDVQVAAMGVTNNVVNSTNVTSNLRAILGF